MQQITYLYTGTDGLEIDCTLEYDPPDEHYPPAAFLITACVGGINIVDVLSSKVVDRIEEAAAWSMLD